MGSSNSVTRMQTKPAQQPPRPNSASPPPYSSHTERNSPDARSTALISASSVPQWSWSNAECRSWVYLFLTQRCGWAAARACETISRIEGFGGSLYLRKVGEWIDLLGYVDGEGVYSHVLSMRNMQGAVPSSIRIVHGKERPGIGFGVGLAL